MIFITTGTQEPFDRMLKAVDEVAALFPNEEFVAQVFKDKYEPKHIKTFGFIEPKEFSTLFEKADLVVGHAGMGTIISALTTDKPIVVFPRIASLGEHRNEHQLATVKKLKELGYVRVAQDTEELKNILIDLCTDKNYLPLKKIGNYASESLLKAIKAEIKELL